MLQKLLCLTISFLLISCANKPKNVEPEQLSAEETEVLVEEALESYSQLEEQSVESEDIEMGEAQKERNYVLLPKEMNKRIKKWIRYYSVKDKERFQRFLNRGAKYKEVIEDLLEEGGLPPDLYYLGIIESGYRVNAVSRVGAVGPWQFMRPTGREYGLRINYYVDERQDPIRSTESAIKYLRWLKARKGTWELAMAAYNAGPGTVRRAVRRGGTKDYWRLTKGRHLPRDTREYVSQFLAALVIGRNLERFGFHEKADRDFPDVELITLPSPIRLTDVAAKTGIDLETLKQVNPHIVRGVTPPEVKTYDLWVPSSHREKALAANDVLQGLVVKGLKPRRHVADVRGVRYHRVRRGQTLGHIARRYRISLSYLKNLNGLKSNRIMAGQRLRVKSGAYKRSHTYHIVRKGQTLSGIAQRYRMSLRRLKSMNRIRSSRIFIGQKIRVKARRGVSNYATVTAKDGQIHVVRSGQNLGLIARKYKTSIRSLKNLNGLRGNRIYVGQKLLVKAKSGGKSKVVRASKSNVVKYKVRRGDNLSKIANSFRTSVRKIKKLNGLRSNTIRPGQFLKVAQR